MTVATTEVTPSIETIDVHNPMTGELLYSVSDPSAEELTATYVRANAAYEKIKAMSIRQRLDEVQKLKNYIIENREKIVDQICSETGKARTDCLLSEIFSVIDTIDYYDANAEKQLADRKVSTPLVLFPKKSFVYYEPIGTVLIISPWNYPFNLTLCPFISAFISGNPIIYKPSEQTPLKGLVEEMVEKSGFMKDAFQVVYGGRNAGAACIDQRPAKVFFTGSCRGGSAVMAHAAQYLIPVELELGGKDPMVVFDDVDIERTVNGAIWGGMANSGQTCTSVERILVQESIFDKFVSTLKEKAENVETPSRCKTDDPNDLDVGCMTADFQIDIVMEQIEDARSKGATIVTGGNRIGTSHEIEPTVITGITDEMMIAQDETFGPVVTVQKFSSEAEAIVMSNDTPYGLSASVWTADAARAERIARAIDTGNVSINNVLATQANPGLPFGGTKQSGFGRYKGHEGLLSFSNTKSVMFDKQGNHLEFYWYPSSKGKYAHFSELVAGMTKSGIAKILGMLGPAGKLKKMSENDRL